MKTPTPSAHSRDANALAYFVGTAFVAILFFLPLCTLLNLYVADGLLSALTGDPLRLSRDNDFAAAVVCFSLTIPGICGGRLAAHAHIAATFIARYLPLLLPLPLFLAVLILCVRSCFGSAPLYRLAGLAFLLTYGPFLLNFLNWSRACPPARGRRAGMVCLLLVLAPFCAGLAVSLHDTQATLITGDHDAVGVIGNENFWKAFTPDRPDNALARPSAPPSLRLGETLPRLNGILAARPLYVAAIRAVSRLDADGRPLPDKTWIERLARAGVLMPHHSPDSVDIFFGLPPSERQLAAIFQELEERGAENINLVTAAHYVPQLLGAFRLYRPKIPVVWNTHSYEKLEALKALDRYIDVYLPDLKYFSPRISERYTGRADYFDVASRAVAFMAQRRCDMRGGKLYAGCIVRHLVLPLCVNDSIALMKWFLTLQTDAYFSLMGQYTPCGDISAFPELSRRITPREYKKAEDFLISSGYEHIFLQALGAADEQFIPDFSDGTDTLF